MTDQLDTAAIRTRSQQPGYQEGQALIDVIALCDALDDLAKRDRELRIKVERMVTQIIKASNQARYRRAEIKGHQRRIVSLQKDNERLRAALAPCVKMLDDLVSESGRDVDWGHEDAFRMGEWFEAHDMDAIGAARAELAQKEDE